MRRFTEGSEEYIIVLAFAKTEDDISILKDKLKMGNVYLHDEQVMEKIKNVYHGEPLSRVKDKYATKEIPLKLSLDNVTMDELAFTIEVELMEREIDGIHCTCLVGKLFTVKNDIVRTWLCTGFSLSARCLVEYQKGKSSKLVDVSAIDVYDPSLALIN